MKSTDVPLSKIVATFLLYIYTIFCFTSYELIALYAMVPLAFIITVWGYWKTKMDVYMKYLLALYFWIFITSFNAKYQDLASAQIHQILGCTIFCYTIYILAQEKRLINWLHGLWILFFIISLNFALTHAMSIAFDYTSERLNADEMGMNANHLSQFTLYLTISIYLLGNYVKKPRLIKFFRILYICILPLSAFIAIITASRQLLLQIIPIFFILIYIRYSLGKRAGSIKNLVYLLLFFVFLKFFQPIYDRSYLAERNQLSYEEDTRIELVKSAFEIGLEHPIMGVGPGNFVRYSYNKKNAAHNTFLENFANSGFFALWCSFAMIGIFLIRQFRRYKKYRDKQYLAFLIIGLFYFFGNFFISFHTSLWLIGYFILITSQSEIYYKEQIISKQV